MGRRFGFRDVGLRVDTAKASRQSSSVITLAQVDGARRDFLETITHGPRGDIVSMYTTFPWPDLCAEVAKLRVGLRECEIVAFPTVPLQAPKERGFVGNAL